MHNYHDAGVFKLKYRGARHFHVCHQEQVWCQKTIKKYNNYYMSASQGHKNVQKLLQYFAKWKVFY